MHLTQNPKPARRRRHILIVGPSSVLGNWQRELGTWGAFRVAIYHGGKRDLALQGVLQGRTEVLITSYATYRWAATYGPLNPNI